MSESRSAHLGRALVTGAFAFATFLAGAGALAHPVSYQGALAVMTWNQAFLSDRGGICFWTLALKKSEGRKFLSAPREFVLN